MVPARRGDLQKAIQITSWDKEDLLKELRTQYNSRMTLAKAMVPFDTKHTNRTHWTWNFLTTILQSMDFQHTSTYRIMTLPSQILIRRTTASASPTCNGLHTTPHRHIRR